MAVIPIYPGSSSFFPGDTPFGFYDNQIDFQTDADRVVTYVSRRLGSAETGVGPSCGTTGFGKRPCSLVLRV